VNLIRREFLKELTGTVTPEEYADQAVITIAKADELLEAADESTESKAIRLGESKYFPLADHELVILQESKRARQEEELLTEEAENLFWNSEDLSDDERERRYWETFEDITSESKGVNNPEDPYDPLLDTESTVRFDEDRHIAIIDDGPDMVPLTPRMRAKVHSWIQLLPKQYSDVIYAIYIREEEPGAILKHAHECRQTITNRQKRGLRLLKSGSRLFYLRDYEALDDEDIRKGFVTAAGLTRLELAFLSPEARKTVARMQLEYLGLQTLALRRRGILWNDLGSASSD